MHLTDVWMIKLNHFDNDKREWLHKKEIKTKSSYSKLLKWNSSN